MAVADRTGTGIDPARFRARPDVFVGPSIYRESRIPRPVPTILPVPEDLRDSEDVLQVNFGPNHPSTHGVLRLVVDLHGETVVGLRAVIGYLHTGFEKNMEAKTWWKAITYGPRIDYVSFQNNEYVFVAAVEKLLAMEVPEKAVWMRMCLNELNRIHSHLVWLGTSALEIGAISMFWYAFRERETILDLFELVSGYRMHTRYFQVGGLAEDIPAGFFPEARKFCDWMPKAVDDYEGLLTDNRIWRQRTEGLGVLSAEDAVALGQSGPVLRASGVDWDLRKRQPYLAYDQVDFDVPVYTNGDVYDRYRVHIDEMRQSVRIVRQSLDRLEEMEGEPWIADDRKVVLPPREELHTSMESLIHHFKIVTEGYRVPEGEVYVAVESPRGESGCYLVSDGGPKPWRVKFRAPSFAALEATAACMTNAAVADLIAIVGSLDAVMGDTDR
jgi:NADH-quinone oxidoreductase subunit D